MKHDNKTISEEKRKVLVQEMYELLASTSAEMSRLEDIMDELISCSNDDDKINQLVIMNVTIREYRLKFGKMTNMIFDKKFNIVELCKRLHKSDKS